MDMDEFLNIGLQKLQDFVVDDEERIRLITCIMKHRINISAKDPVTSPDSSPLQRKDPDYTSEDSNNGFSESDSEIEVVGRRSKRPSKEKVQVDEGNNENPPQAETSISQAPQVLPSLPSRLQNILTRNNFVDLDLKAYLASSKSWLTIFTDQVNGVLSDKSRKLLVNVLAEYMLNHKRSLEKEDYLRITAKIYELFPKEPEVIYYVALGGENNRLARGKLFDACRNKVNKLIERGAIQPLRMKRKSTGSSSLDEETVETEAPPSDVKTALVVLKRSLEITPDTESEWKITAEYRLKSLYGKAKTRSSKSAKSSKAENGTPDVIVKYYEEYKILRNPKGYLLLLADFNFMYEAESNNLFTAWPELQAKIEKLACNTKISDPVGVDLITRLKLTDNPLDENSRDAILFQLLPSLCIPSARVTVGIKSFKPSVLESRDAFICYITVGADLEPLIERRRKHMTTLKAPLQPYLIFLGPSRCDILAVYIAFDNVYYKLGSVLESVDACFKAYHALCVSYPKEANQLWHFLHLYVYKIKHNPALEGVVPLATKTFMASLDSQ